MATSAEDLDAAVLDRCDESLYIPIPDSPCRSKLLSLYFDYYVRQAASENNKKSLAFISRIKCFLSKRNSFIIKLDEHIMQGEHLEKTIKATKGFSAREIGKLMIAVQSALYVSENGLLKKCEVWDITKTKVSEHRDKQHMLLSTGQ